MLESIPFRYVVFVWLAGVVFCGQARAQAGPPAPYQDPIEGEWSVEDTQTNTGTVTAEIVETEVNGVFTYVTKDSEGETVDSGAIVKVMGGYQFVSAQDGGSGVIQSNGDGTYAWQNNETGAGGTMTEI